MGNSNSMGKFSNVITVVGQGLGILIVVGGLLSRWCTMQIQAIELQVDSRTSSIEDTIAFINKYHEKYCLSTEQKIADVNSKLDNKLSKDEVYLYLDPIKQSIETIERNMKEYQAQDAQFKREIIKLLKE